MATSPDSDNNTLTYMLHSIYFLNNAFYFQPMLLASEIEKKRYPWICRFSTESRISIGGPWVTGERTAAVLS